MRYIENKKIKYYAAGNEILLQNAENRQAWL